MNEKPTVIVAMSGGVDSSVAAGLLRQQGYGVIGATLRLRPGTEGANVKWCCGAGAEEQSRAVAGVLGIRHYVIEASDAFESSVLRPSWAEYDRGRTPSPCILCNERIKIRILLDLARKVGAAKVATGHYARIERERGSQRPVLLRGLDRQKDQSYFLFSLTPAQLRSTLFPLGGLTKPEVRDLARGMGFANAERLESQDACFVLRESGFAEALRLKFRAAPRPGDVVDDTGRKLGEHRGIHRYTVGQRKGLGIALGRRAYVSRIDAETAQVVLSHTVEALESPSLRAADPVWTGGVIPPLPVRCQAQIRYRHAPVRAEASLNPDGSLVVTFDEPQKAIAPGQAVVLYDGDRVLGGAWIR